MLTLACESSCDDTAVALVADGREVVVNLISSQIEIHRRFGGVVPEVASRKHLEAINPLLGEALAAGGGRRIDLVAATAGPGLLGALLVGLAAGKAAALALGVPLVPVHHLEAHFAAAFLGAGRPLEHPFLGLVVSGGHATLARAEGPRRFTVLAATQDDAPGELFDKIARHLGLGYPGGPAIQRGGEGGDPERYPLPRPMAHQPDAMSFSGLKTAVLNLVRQAGDTLSLPDLCASLEEAVADTLARKVAAALERGAPPRLVLAGGVAANRRLRHRLAALAAHAGLEFLVPPIALCTDNAAMVAAQGFASRDLLPAADALRVNAVATWPLGGNWPL